MNRLLADDSHEIPSVIFSEKKYKNRMSSATILLSALKFKVGIEYGDIIGLIEFHIL